MWLHMVNHSCQLLTQWVQVYPEARKMKIECVTIYGYLLAVYGWLKQVQDHPET